MSISDISSNESGEFRDKDISVSNISSNESGEIEDSDTSDDGFYKEIYFDELVKQPLKSSQNNEEFVTHVDTRKITGGIDFSYIHDQDMSYYREIDNHYLGGRPNNDETFENFNKATMLGRIDVPTTSTKSVEYDPQYDEEVNKILDELAEDLEEPDTKPKDEKSEKSHIINDDKEKYEDYYDEFPEDEKDDNTYEWYELMCKKKLEETKRRLGELSNLVCYASASTREQIMRLERDHNTPFCKLDFPRHPPLNKPWINYWRFNCVLKCRFEDKLPPDALHAHTPDCEMVLLEHVNTGISTRSKNIIACEFPKFLMDAVELFQDFVNITLKENEYFENFASDTIYERPIWTYIKLRSNYKNELMLIACGKGITPLLMPLRRYFHNGPGRSCNIVSVYCINIKWSQKKGQFHPTHLTGLLELRDKIGPISMNYSAKTNVNFNSIEAQQLGKIVLEYLSPTPETSLIDIGCNIGALSLMLTQKCEKVIGLNTLDHEVKLAEEIKLCNQLYNASFLVCQPKEIQTKCSPLVKKCITVAILNLGTTYGKCPDVMKALRNLPSIWRVVLYGTFTKDFHRNITLLTSRDEQLGDEFLPMQGCMLDTFPTVENAFNIVILFERKSLIEPSIELIGVGPTVNIRTDTNGIPWKCKDEIKSEAEYKVKTGKKYGNKGYIKIENPFPKHNRPSLRYGKFDSPMVSLKKEPESNEKAQSDQKPAVLTIPVLTVPKTNPKPVNPIKILRKIYDCPSLPIQTDNAKPNDPQLESINKEPKFTQIVDSLEKSSHNQLLIKPEVSNPKPIPSFNDMKRLSKIYDCPPLPNQNKDVLSNKCNSIQVKKEFHLPSIVNRIEIPLKNWSPSQSFVQKAEATGSSNDIKRLRKIYDCPPLPKQNDECSSNSFTEICNQDFSIPPPPISKLYQYDNRSSVNQQEVFDIPVIKTEIKEEPHRPFYFAPMPKVEHMDSDAEESESAEDGDKQAQKEDNVAYSDVNIKPEPMDLDEEEDEQTLIEHVEIPQGRYENVSMDGCNSISSTLDTKAKENSMINTPNNTIKVKSEPIDNGYKDDDPYDPAMPIKSEPVESVIVKKEPVESNILPSIENLDDFANMPTPIHNPAALANRNRSLSPVKPPTNFTIDGYQFCVQPNQSYLQNLEVKVKPDPDDPEQQPERLQEAMQSIIAVKQEELLEPGEILQTHAGNAANHKNSEIDDEISVISCKPKIKIEKQEYRDSTEEERRQRALAEEMRIQELEEKRKQLQMELNRDLEQRHSQYRYDSLSTRRTRSPSSPIYKRYRSPSATRYRSPYSPDRPSWSKRPSGSSAWRTRSPDSPTNRRRRSPDSPISRRGRSPMSPVSRRYRSPVSPVSRRYRSPVSPVSRRYRSSITPEFTIAKSPLSPSRREQPWISPKEELPWNSFRRRRSPDSPPTCTRSKSPFDQKSRYKGTPPAQYRLKSSTPPVRKRRRSPVMPEYDRSRSPFDQKKHRYKKSKSSSSSKSKHTRYSSTPPLRSKYSWAEKPSLDPRNGSQSSSQSPSSPVHEEHVKHLKKSNEAPENDVVGSSNKIEDEWDIPALSSLEDSSSIKKKTRRGKKVKKEKKEKKEKEETSRSSNSPTSTTMIDQEAT